MGIITADDRLTIGARRFQRGEMMFGMNLEPVAPRRDIARRVERQNNRPIAVPCALHQPAALAGKGRMRLLLDKPAKFARQCELHFSALALTCPTRWPFWVSRMSISSPVAVLMRRIRRPGWLSMLTMREPGARVKFDGNCAGVFLPPPANFITAPTTSAIRARIIRLERIITAIFAAFSAGLFCGSGRM